MTGLSADAGVRIGIKSYNFFFDRQQVINGLDRKRYKVLQRTGAYGRKVMRSGFRVSRKGKSAAPGQIPMHHARGGQGLKRVLYEYNKHSESVAIAPRLFRTPGQGLVPKNGARPGMVSNTNPINTMLAACQRWNFWSTAEKRRERFYFHLARKLNST